MSRLERACFRSRGFSRRLLLRNLRPPLENRLIWIQHAQSGWTSRLRSPARSSSPKPQPNRSSIVRGTLGAFLVPRCKVQWTRAFRLARAMTLKPADGEKDGIKSFDKDARGNWVEITPRRIEELKSMIDLYEHCIRHLEGRSG